MENIIDRILDRQLSIAVVGAGYVGLSMASMFAEAGFEVIAKDISQDVVSAINSCSARTMEPNLKEIISRCVRSGKLKARLNEVDGTHDTDVVLIAVPTPVRRNKSPNLSELQYVLLSLGKNLRKDMIVVVVSSIPPGTMEKEVRPILESRSGLKADEDFSLAYAPERVSPGNTLQEFVNNPRLVGGIGPNSTRVVSALFRTVCKEVIETEAATAEVTKLAENAFRDVNIAFVNQLALICEHNRTDVKTVIELANTHPRVRMLTPGPGVGGPCLTKDSYLLVQGSNLGNGSLMKVARDINDSMPSHIAQLAKKGLMASGKKVRESKVAVLGVSYKRNTADTRSSPSSVLVRRLNRMGTTVGIHDPHVMPEFEGFPVEDLEVALDNADCMIIMVDHDEFMMLDLRRLKTLMNKNPVIVDGRRILNPRMVVELGFLYYGTGCLPNRNDVD